MRISRDITNALPKILDQGRETIRRIRSDPMKSRTWKRKWGILDNPWKKRDGKRRT